MQTNRVQVLQKRAEKGLVPEAELRKTTVALDKMQVSDEVLQKGLSS